VFTQFNLKLPVNHDKSKREVMKDIDWVGTILLVGGLVTVLLAASFGGNQYEWNSLVVILLFIGGGLMIIMFLWNEYRYSAQPIIPMRLFTIRNVILCNGIAFLIGFVMFGAISYLPVYFQEILGDSPTTSGLKLIPLMFGLIIASMGSGIMITKTGHYWHFPILGCLLCGVGSGLLYLITADYSYGLLCIYVILIGFGIGFLLQTLLIITQFSVQKKDMAVGTATNSFVRTMGGVIGVTILGAVLNASLKKNLDANLVLAAQGGHAAISALPSAVQTQIYDAYVDALRLVFISSVPVAGLALILSFAITRKKIAKKTPNAKGAEEGNPEEIFDVETPAIEL